MAQKDFAVVSFINEKGALYAVQSTWLLGNNKCRWPIYATDARIAKAARTKETVNENWGKHDVRIMHFIGINNCCFNVLLHL